ncbi:MAG: hypothetical protein AAF871_07720 [Pseudomonadota bacterium]
MSACFVTSASAVVVTEQSFGNFPFQGGASVDVGVFDDSENSVSGRLSKTCGGTANCDDDLFDVFRFSIPTGFEMYQTFASSLVNSPFSGRFGALLLSGDGLAEIASAIYDFDDGGSLLSDSNPLGAGS